MSLPLQIVVIVSTIILLLFVLRLVTKGRLVLKYALLWLALATIILLCAIFPQIIYSCAEVLGFTAPSNFAFLVGVFFLLAITLSLSIIVSWQSQYIRRLIQELALVEKKIEEIKEQIPSKR